MVNLALVNLSSNTWAFFPNPWDVLLSWILLVNENLLPPNDIPSSLSILPYLNVPLSAEPKSRSFTWAYQSWSGACTYWPPYPAFHLFPSRCEQHPLYLRPCSSSSSSRWKSLGLWYRFHTHIPSHQHPCHSAGSFPICLYPLINVILQTEYNLLGVLTQRRIRPLSVLF